MVWHDHKQYSRCKHERCFFKGWQYYVGKLERREARGAGVEIAREEGGEKADNRKTGERLSRGLDFLKNHRKPLESFKQEISTIQLMIEIDDFGRGAGKSTLSRDRRRSQQMG